MPDQGIGAALRTIRETFSISLDAELGDIEIGYLARIFGVSFAVAAQRCENLELLPVGGAGSLVAALEKEYRSAERRGDQAGLPPRIPIIIPRISSTLLRALKAALDQESISIGFASEIFSLPPAQLIEELRKEA